MQTSLVVKQGYGRLQMAPPQQLNFLSRLLQMEEEARVFRLFNFEEICHFEEVLCVYSCSTISTRQLLKETTYFGTITAFSCMKNTCEVDNTNFDCSEIAGETIPVPLTVIIVSQAILQQFQFVCHGLLLEKALAF